MSAPLRPGALMELGGAVLMANYARYPLELVSGEGCRLVDAGGRSYLDFASGIAVSALGHQHPAMVRAMREAAGGLVHVSNLYWTEPMVRLAERLTAAAGMERAFFCNSGAEAVEAALKLGRRARPDCKLMLAFQGSFHGRTLGALSATANPGYQAPFRPLLPGIEILPWADLAAVEAAMDGGVSLVLVEPIQGEGGLRPAPRGFLGGLRELCDAAGTLLVFDEVQSGMGRTGSLFAYQQSGVMPDAVCVAKALAGGLPMGALLARGEAARAFVPGDHASTFGGGPLVSKVALAVLDEVLAPQFQERVRQAGERLRRGLAALAAGDGLVEEVRGRGLMLGLALSEPRAPRLVELLTEEGLLAVPAGTGVLRLLPPLVVSPEEIDEALVILRRALQRLARERRCEARGEGR